MTVPGTRTQINLPDRKGWAWHAGMGALAAVDVVQWPVALLIAGTHFIESHSRSRDVQELAEGIDAGL